MKLENFSVENYRSITQARQIPLSNSTVLIGPNNEGKSNILRALNAAMFALTRSTRRFPPFGVGQRLASPIRNDFSKFYDFSKDFPATLLNSSRNSPTKVNLEFSLNETEIIEFKNEIKSTLNGTLPVCITFLDGQFDIKIVKHGRGSTSLNSKSDRIAKFLAERIQFQYIPAVRTAQQATRIVESIIAAELSEVEKMPE